MNGDDKKLALDYWQLWETRHNEDAVEHRQDVKDIKDTLSVLPCLVHIEKMNWIIWAIRGSYMFTALTVGWLSWLILEHISKGV